MKIAFRVPATEAMPAASGSYRVLADIYRFEKSGPEVYRVGVPLTVSVGGRRTDPLELPRGSYQFNVNLGNGRSGIATVDEDDAVAKSGITVSEISVIGGIDDTLFGSAPKPDRRRSSDISFEAFRRLGKLAVPVLAMDGPSSPADSARRRVSLDVLSRSNREIFELMDNAECGVRELASAYLGRVGTVFGGATAKGRPASASRKDLTSPFSLVAEKHAFGFAPSPTSRIGILTVGHKSLETITYKPIVDGKSKEIFDFQDDASEEGRWLPRLKARDVTLEAILRYQGSGDIRSAMRLIDADGRDRLSFEDNPLLSTASAYTMLNRQVEDNMVARSWGWLSQLEQSTTPLPDVQIIMAALLVCRNWSGLSTASKLANKAKRDEMACELAFMSLLKGPPAFRFGFSILSDAFALLAVSESPNGSAVASRAKKASAMLAWLSTRVDMTQPCTSISLW